MVQTEEIEVMGDENNSVEPENREKTPSSLKVSSTKGTKKKGKSPTPGVRAVSQSRERSVRSSTPFSLYLTKHNEDPNALNKFRSITPFINRQSKEKTPFELGKDVKSQLISHKMVFDRASVMDISGEVAYEPVRYITSDASALDRASVMDISNVEIIYMVEEYDDDDDEEEIIEDQVEIVEETSKKKKGKKGNRKSKSVSVDKETSPGGADDSIGSSEKKTKVTKKKADKKKKKKTDDDDDEEERSPTPPPLPKLKLELGGGSKMNKKMFEQKAFGPEAKPPPKAVKPSVQFEESNKKHLLLPEESARNSEVRDEESSIMLDDSRDGSVAVEDESFEHDQVADDNFGDQTENADGQLNKGEHDQGASSVNNIEGTAGENDRLSEQQQTENEKDSKKNTAKKDTEPEDEEGPTPLELEKINKIEKEEGREISNKIRKFLAQKRNDPQNPCFISQLPNGFAREDQNLRLVCAVNGDELKIKWYKGDKEIKSDDRYVTKADKNNILSLEIKKLVPTDSGEYSCLIYNKKKKARSTCFVSVYDLSKFMDEPEPPSIAYVEDAYHYIKDELILECKVRGCPRPIVTWTRENEMEIFSDHITTEEAHGIHRLIINHPTPMDSGIYEVKAVNSRGQYERKHLVEFLISTEKVHVEEAYYNERALALLAAAKAAEAAEAAAAEEAAEEAAREARELNEKNENTNNEGSEIGEDEIKQDEDNDMWP